MTDTTDISALRSEAANIIGLLNAAGHETFSLDKTADFFDDVFRLLEAERQRADDWKQVVDLRDSEIANLNDKLATPVSLPKAAYFNSSAENLPFFRAFQVIEAIHKVGFLTVTYED